MLAFERVTNKEISLNELVAELTVQDMHDLTDEMIDTMVQLVDGCTDADVVFRHASARQTGCPVTHGRSSTQRMPRPATTKSFHRSSMRDRAAAPRSAPPSTG